MARATGGRAGRHLRRSKALPINPAPPGGFGGQYKPLSMSDMEQIYDVALRLLEELGVGEVPDRLRDLFVQQGARFEAGRIYIPRRLIAQAVAAAPKTITLHGRDPARSIEVGGDRVHFGTGGAAVQTLDLDSGDYRASTLQDLYDFARLQDQLTNVSWFTRCCVATDLVGEEALDINTAYALLAGTSKPVATSFTLADHVAPIVKMMDMAEGREGAFSERPWLAAHISPMISPLRFGADAVEVCFECVAHNITVSCITAAQSGATAPATPAAFLAQSLAETLAALAMVHVMKPGHPMIFSNWPFVIDLRSGAFSGGGGEIALMNAASAQLSNWLGLVSGVASSMTDSKAIDAQYGAEKGVTALAAALSGANMIYESAGMTAALLGVSFEGFVLDNDMLGNIYRMLRGIEVTDENLGFDVIVDVVQGEGHFLGHPQTMAAMERDYFYPETADREAPITWCERGSMDAQTRAKATARTLLQRHPTYLSAQADAGIRAAFDIQLPPQR